MFQNNANLTQQNSKQEIQLYGPQDAGYVFETREGVWSAPPNDNSNNNTDNNLHNNDHGDNISAMANSISMTNSTMDNDMTSGNYGDMNNTRIDSPKFDVKYMPPHVEKKEPDHSLPYLNSNGDITTGSKLETSFRESRIKLISVLTEKISSKTDWQSIFELTINGENLRNIVSLNENLPNLLYCNLDDNELESLEGVPAQVMELSCCNNNLTSVNFSIDQLIHLEKLNVSHNLIHSNLSLLGSSLLCSHLKYIDLSNNKINSLEGLSDCQPIQLNLANNNIVGTVDFAKLILHTPGPLNGWLTVEELNLSGNAITSIHNLSSLPNLKILRLDGNPIEYINDTNECETLETLTLLNTSKTLQYIGEGEKLPYPRLHTLKIDGNFPGLLQLQELPLTLQILHVENGSVDTLPSWDLLPDTLRSLTLTHIHGLSQIPLDLRYRLPLLKKLNLSHNELHNCYDFIEAIPSFCLEELDLRGNRFIPTCEEIWSYRHYDTKTARAVVHVMRAKFEEALGLTCPCLSLVLL